MQTPAQPKKAVLCGSWRLLWPARPCRRASICRRLHLRNKSPTYQKCWFVSAHLSCEKDGEICPKKGFFKRAERENSTIVILSRPMAIVESAEPHCSKAGEARSSNPVSLHDAFLLLAGAFGFNRNLAHGSPSCTRLVQQVGPIAGVDPVSEFGLPRFSP